MKRVPERGEVYLVSLGKTVGAEINKVRPALIVSNDINNELAQTVTVVPITSNTTRVYPFEALLSPKESGLSKKSKAKCNHIRSIDKKRLVKFLGKVSERELKKVEEALLLHLGIYL